MQSETDAPLGSVTPPAGNREATIAVLTMADGDEIERTADSLFAQSFRCWEWILMVPRSFSEEMRSRIGELAERDARVRVVDCDAGCSALKTGLHHTAAPFFARVGAGMRLETTVLEQSLWSLVTHPLRAADEPVFRRVEPESMRPSHAPSTALASGGAGLATISEQLPFENPLPKERPRLLLLVPWVDVGGADRFTLQILAELDRRGWETTVVATGIGDGAWLTELVAITTDVFALQRFLEPEDQPRFIRYLIESRDFDAMLLSHSELGYQLLPYLRAHFPRLPVIDVCHVVEESHGGGYPRWSNLYGEFLDRTIVTSRALADWLAARGSDRKRLCLAYTGVDPSEWRPDPARREQVRSELGIAADATVVLTVARVCPQKQPDVLCAALRLALDAQDRTTIALIAGGGPDLPWLQRLVRRASLRRRVRLLGAVGHPQVGDLMAAADVFFLPSRYEGVALTLYEAMACGLPVVAARTGGQGELVTEACGILVEPKERGEEAAAYAAALRRLLDDRALRRTMGAAGRERITGGFSWSQTSAQILRALDEARALRSTNGGALPPGTLERVSAALAVTEVRKHRGLWWERESAPAAFTVAEGAHLLDPYRAHWSLLAYFSLRQIFWPLYRDLFARASTRTVALREWTRRALLRLGAGRGQAP